MQVCIAKEIKMLDYEKRRKEDNRSFLRELIEDNWQYLTYIIFVVGFYFSLIIGVVPRVKALECDIKTQDTRLTKLEVVISENLPSIKEFMKEMRDDVKRRK